MYHCKTCGGVFGEPGVECQSHPYGDGYAEESRSCCPKCGGDYEEIIGECKNCEKVIPGTAKRYFQQDDMLFCSPECAMEHNEIEEVRPWRNQRE